MPAFRLLLRVTLELEEGIEVVGEAGNGRDAVALAGDMRPDVLLLDIAMPELDGLEALPLLREASPGTRVVVLTGFARTDLQERALELGAVRYLEKGIDPEALAAEIRDTCKNAV